MGGLVRGLGETLGVVWRAIRARPGLFLGVAVAVILLDFFLPLAVLAVFRKPWNYFTFNPWLPSLPGWLVSSQATLARKIEFLSNLSLLWFVANNSYGETDWGFSVGVPDVVRWLYMGALFGAYFALWLYARGSATRRPVAVSRGGAIGRRSGSAGALLSTLGLMTSPCSVAGCGLPVLPVMGLALQGLTSGTLAAVTTVSHAAALIVLWGMTLGVAALGWIVGRQERPGLAGGGRTPHAHKRGFTTA
jgi:hypothetical protein